MTTKIEWADMTINPIVGCSHCSPGCDNCYAERFAARMAKNPKTAGKYKGVVDENGKWTGRISGMDLSVFNLPRKPQRVFVGSMTDMFHPALDDNEGQGMRAMLQIFWMYPQHTFMLLTKRPDRMKADVDWLIAQDGDLPENLWLGVTICNQAEADAKIPVLLQTPAAVRYVSVEPMLGPVDLSPWDVCDECGHRRNEFDPCNDMGSPWGGSICYNHYCYRSCEGTFSKHSLDWVICGGETGPGARPMHPDWVRSLRDQCQSAGVPFFFKGWGEWHPWGEKLSCGNINLLSFKKNPSRYVELENSIMSRVGKRSAGRLLDGREWNEIPEVHNDY